MLLAKGELTLVLGTATVSVPKIPSDAVVVLSRRSALGTIANLNWSITTGESFTVTSLNILDVSVVRWAVLV